jgi:hypothetical protein
VSAEDRAARLAEALGDVGPAIRYQMILTALQEAETAVSGRALVKLADLIEQEMRRAEDANEKAEIADSAGHPNTAATHRTARYWHQRTIQLIQSTVPTVKGLLP